MWIPFSKGRGWGCEQCKNNKALRLKRGNCGGPLKSTLPQSLRDDQGVYMPGYRLAPNSGEEYSDLKIRSCPISNMNRLALIISSYNRIKGGLISFADAYPHPTIAIIESIEILDYNHEQARLRQLEQQRINNGSS